MCSLRKTLLALALTSVTAGTTAAQTASEAQTVSTDRSAFEFAIENVMGAAEEALVSAAIKLVQSPAELFYSGCRNSGRNCTGDDTNGWLLDLVPEFDIKAGDGGAFQRFNGKITGNFITAPLATENRPDFGDPDLKILDLEKLHIFPVAVQVETTRSFNSIAAIGEVGYVPFVPHLGTDLAGNPLQLGVNPYFGLFVQGGHKFSLNSNPVTGNSTDESSEANDSWITRLKADFTLDTALPALELGSFSAKSKLMTRATGWYDIANNDFYHSQSVTLRFEFPESKNRNFDLKFENGSGEPNFNTGSQFTAGLSWTF